MRLPDPLRDNGLRYWLTSPRDGVYIDTDDQWVGRYRSPRHNYFCPLPCVVVRVPRRRPNDWPDRTIVTSTDDTPLGREFEVRSRVMPDEHVTEVLPDPFPGTGWYAIVEGWRGHRTGFVRTVPARAITPGRRGRRGAWRSPA